MPAFIKLCLYPEVSEAGSQVEFGVRQDAYVAVKGARPSEVSVNVNSIAAYEGITIRTIGRPGTSDNKADCITGIRIKFHDGQTAIVFNDAEVTFDALLSQVGGVMAVHGPSRYFTKFEG